MSLSLCWYGQLPYDSLDCWWIFGSVSLVDVPPCEQGRPRHRLFPCRRCLQWKGWKICRWKTSKVGHWDGAEMELQELHFFMAVDDGWWLVMVELTMVTDDAWWSLMLHSHHDSTVGQLCYGHRGWFSICDCRSMEFVAADFDLLVLQR